MRADFIRSCIAFGSVGTIVRTVQLDWPSSSDLTSSVPWVFLAILVIGYCAALFRYRGPYERTSKVLRNAVEEVKATRSAYDDGKADTDGPASDLGDGGTPPETWTTTRPRALKALAKHQSLRDAWIDFHKARAGSGTRQERSPVSPSEFFTVEKALGRPPESLPDRLPGVFTAIGLLGTFVGIALGLADILPQEDSAAATEDLMQGIRTLMGGMSTAFLTSIVGITWSVWWQFEFRIAEHRLKSALDRFQAVATRLFPVEEPHETLLRVAGSNESVGRTAEEIKVTAEEIKGNVQSLGQDLADALEPYLEKHIGDPIRNLNTDLGERQTQALGRMVEAFRETLVSSVKQQLNDFGEALRAASNHQANAARELEAFFDKLVKVGDAQSKLLSRTTEVATVFDRGLAQLTAATGAIESAGKSARETMTVAREAMEVAQRVSQETRQQLESQKKVSEAARRAWYAQASLLEDVQADLKRLATDLGDKITEFRTASAQKISEVFHVFDSEMAKVVDHLSGTLDELRTVAEDLPAAIAKLRDTTQDLADVAKAERDSLARGLRAFEDSQANLVGQFEETRTEIRGLGRTLPALANDFKTRQTELAAAMDNLQLGLDAMVEEMAAGGARSEKDRKRLAASIEAVVVRISKAADSVVTAVVPMGKRTAAVSDHLDHLSEHTQALTAALSGLHVKTNRLFSATGSHRGEKPQRTQGVKPKAGAGSERTDLTATSPSGIGRNMQTESRSVPAERQIILEPLVDPQKDPKTLWGKITRLFRGQ